MKAYSLKLPGGDGNKRQRNKRMAEFFILWVKALPVKIPFTADFSVTRSLV